MVENNNMAPDFKAKHLSHMRQFIERQGKPEDPDDMNLNPIP